MKTHLSRAYSLTQLTGDTSLLARRVPAQGMLSTETGTEGPLLKWVVDGSLLPKYHTASNTDTCNRQTMV